MKQRILSRAIRPLTGKRSLLFNKQIVKCMTVILLLIGCCNGNQVQAQNAVINVTIVPVGSSSTHWLYNVQVSAGQGYVTNDNDFGVTNPNGSWTSLKLVFTTPGVPVTSSMTNSTSMVNAAADIISSAVDSLGFQSVPGTYIAPGTAACFATDAATYVRFNRLPPAPVPDASTVPFTIGTIGLKKTIWPAGTLINLRGTQASASCNAYTSVWTSGQFGSSRPVNALSVPLPLDLIRFNGTLLNGCTTHLSWEVANSDHFSHVEVAYKGDNGDFSTIKTMAYSASNNGKYQFDYNSPTGNGYYKLKVTEMDGSSYYSDVLFIANNCKENADTILLYPNQVWAGQRITLKYNSGHNGTAAIWLTNASGMQYKLQTIPVAEGKNSYDINLPILADGLYYIRITATDRSWETPIQKICVMQ